MLDGVRGWVPSYRLSFPLHGLMVSRYRRGKCLTQHQGAGITPAQKTKLSKTLWSKFLVPGPKPIGPKPFIGNVSHNS